jgi:saposin
MKAFLCLLVALFALSCVRTTQAQLTCTICQFVVGEVEKFVAENATESEILAKLADACVILANPKWVQDCKDLVDTYGPSLIQHVINNEPPNVACAAVGLCNSSSLAVVDKKLSNKIKTVNDDIGCAVCTFIVGKVEGYIANNNTESDILAFLEKDCEFLGIKSWVATCQGTVATFGPEIIQLVIDKQPADVVCTEIGLCNSSKIEVAAPAPYKASGNDTVPCELCEMLVYYTEKLIASNKTEGEVIDELTKICAALPIQSWATDCTNMVVEYGDAIVAYIVNEEPPEVVCTEIRLCASTKTAPVVTMHKQCSAGIKC